MTKETISVFDILKIGVGPSSSHTLGPWRAAQRFIKQLEDQQLIDEVEQIQVLLYGSLAKTGKGHGTDIAVTLGIHGEDPVSIDVNTITPTMQNIKSEGKIRLNGLREIPFSFDDDIIFLFNESLDYHPNALTFQAFLRTGKAISETFFSIGGGFVVKENEEPNAGHHIDLPFPIENADELLGWCIRTGLKVSEVVLENETAWRPEEQTREQLLTKIGRASCRTRG